MMIFSIMATVCIILFLIYTIIENKISIKYNKKLIENLKKFQDEAKRETN